MSRSDLRILIMDLETLQAIALREKANATLAYTTKMLNGYRAKLIRKEWRLE